MNHPIWINAWIEAWKMGMDVYDRSRYAWKIYRSLPRGTSPISKNIDATHCHKGHEFTIDNTFVKKDGRRLCKICKRIGANRRNKTTYYKEKRKEYEKNRRSKLKGE